jgi:glycosyltransferase involved in cell wall biosynthesis
MKIIFLTLASISTIERPGIYEDLIRKIRDEGNEIIVVTPIERIHGQSTSLSVESNVSILKVRTPNIQKTSMFEKSIGTLVIDYLYQRAIKKYFAQLPLDLILYTTPPITFIRLIATLKKTSNASTYLLLKDIFPQNAVDLKLMSNKGLIYRHFRKREEKLYDVSDWIGCMSAANRDYILEKNPWIDPAKVEINPNSLEIVATEAVQAMDQPYSQLLEGKVVFVYGGNLGKPQGIEFLLEVIAACEDIENAFFLIVGSGTESRKVLQWFQLKSPPNALYIPELPKHEYDMLLQQCHVGLILLHPDFTIPNYPSRLLPYMKSKMPILCATDTTTDIGSDAVANEYGFWCQSGDLSQFKEYIEILSADAELRKRLGKNAYDYFKLNFNIDLSYKLILAHLFSKDDKVNVEAVSTR